jgi:5'-deoxynucleotidase YfbR-like HD superfamily hydrolase
MELIGYIFCFSEPETVAGHMYRMAVMSILLPENSGVNRIR